MTSTNNEHIVHITCKRKRPIALVSARILSILLRWRRSGETHLQRVASPNRTRVAFAYRRPLPHFLVQFKCATVQYVTLTTYALMCANPSHKPIWKFVCIRIHEYCICKYIAVYAHVFARARTRVCVWGHDDVFPAVTHVLFWPDPSFFRRGLPHGKSHGERG